MQTIRGILPYHVTEQRYCTEGYFTGVLTSARTTFAFISTIKKAATVRFDRYLLVSQVEEEGNLALISVSVMDPVRLTQLISLEYLVAGKKKQLHNIEIEPAAMMFNARNRSGSSLVDIILRSIAVGHVDADNRIHLYEPLRIVNLKQMPINLLIEYDNGKAHVAEYMENDGAENPFSASKTGFETNAVAAYRHARCVNS